MIDVSENGLFKLALRRRRRRRRKVAKHRFFKAFKKTGVERARRRGTDVGQRRIFDGSRGRLPIETAARAGGKIFDRRRGAPVDEQNARRNAPTFAFALPKSGSVTSVATKDCRLKETGDRIPADDAQRRELGRRRRRRRRRGSGVLGSGRRERRRRSRRDDRANEVAAKEVGAARRPIDFCLKNEAGAFEFPTTDGPSEGFELVARGSWDGVGGVARKKRRKRRRRRRFDEGGRRVGRGIAVNAGTKLGCVDLRLTVDDRRRRNVAGRLRPNWRRRETRESEKAERERSDIRRATKGESRERLENVVDFDF